MTNTPICAIINLRSRLLVSVGNTTFEYDAKGRRTKKGSTEYYYDGDKLIAEIRPTGTLYFFYDESGVCGMRYNGANYEFVRNIFGDVIRIYDVNGDLKASYTYDAWGNCTIGTNVGGIATINPFRYRGYYYDVESGLYYLMSRYYDPSIGQFISPDTSDYLAPDTIGGVDLYAYGLNNPVMYVDSTGHMPIIALALIGILIGGVLTGGINIITKEEEESNLGAFTGGFVEGAISTLALSVGLSIGAVTGGAGFIFLGGAIAVVGGFIAGKYGNAVSQQISYGNVDWGVANVNGLFAGLSNLVAYTGLYMNKELISSSGKFGVRLLENIAPSLVGFGISAYLTTLPKMISNAYRDEERIESQEGRFIWEYFI